MHVHGTRVLIEIDGRKFHDNADTWERDNIRDAELVARNFVVIRLSYRQIFADWNWCLRIIREAISLG